MANLEPELRGIQERAGDWWLGWYAINKSESYAARAATTWPRWRKAGFSHPATAPGLAFRAERFTKADGSSALGIIADDPDAGEQVWIGWVSAEREQEADDWVRCFNAEILELQRLWNEAGRVGARDEAGRVGARD